MEVDQSCKIQVMEKKECQFSTLMNIQVRKKVISQQEKNHQGM